MKKNNIILFNPVVEIGETVYHKTDIANEVPMVVNNFNLLYIDAETREVKSYTVGVGSINGGVQYYYPHELKEPVEKEENA